MLGGGEKDCITESVMGAEKRERKEEKMSRAHHRYERHNC